MSPLCYNLGMEGMVRAIVAGLFVMLVVLTIVIFSFSLLLPVKMAKKDQGATPEPAQATPPSLLRLLLELQGQKQQPPPPTGGQPAPSEPAPPPTGGQPAQPTPTQPTQPTQPTPAPSYSLTSIGTSPVKNGVVVKTDGSPVDNKAEPGSSSAPAVSRPIGSSEYPAGSVLLKMSDAGFVPNRFEASAGQPVTLVVQAGAGQSHVFKFNNSDLQGIAIGLAPNEARAVTFNAPSSGDYGFYCDVPGHQGRETGIMSVR